MRLCFGRKNKTLGGIFRQHATLALLQANRDTQAALRSTEQQQDGTGAAGLGADDPMEAPSVVSDEDEGAAMELDEPAEHPARASCKGRGKHRYSESLKQLVLEVLKQGDFEALRTAKLAQEDFLRLLAAFNKAGIHFA